MTADTVVRARIDTDTKEPAAAALNAMGLSISDAIRLLLLRVADERRLPFAARAIDQLEQGKGESFADAEALFEDLGL